MTLPASGPLSLSNVNTEIGVAANALISMNDSMVRGMAGKGSGAVAMSDLYGKDKGWAGTLTISANTQNYNIRTAAMNAGWTGTLPANVTVVINAGVYVGASSTGNFGITTGTFPVGSVITIVNNGYIVGCGGGGGVGSWVYSSGPPGGGGAGGTALSMNYPVTITNNGYIMGGGGGGGGAGQASYSSGESTSQTYGTGGGGGAGYSGGAGGYPNGGAGTVSGGGLGWQERYSFWGGNGGTWATAGARGQGDSGSGYDGAWGGAGGGAIARNGNTITWGGTNGSSTTYVRGSIV